MARKISFNEVKQTFKNNNLELLESKYKNSTTRMKAITNDGYIIVASFNSLQKNNIPAIFHKSNPYTTKNIKLWLIKNRSKFKTTISLKENQKYINTSSQLIFLCDNCDEFSSSWHNISGYKNCNVCRGKVGIATTHPHLVKYFVNNRESSYLSYGSHKFVSLQCPDCMLIKKMQLKKLSLRGFNCNRCGDGFSIPNKFLYSLFKELNLNLNLKTEKSFKNSIYRYDLYVESDTQSYTIEAHGIQHYKESNLFENLSKQKSTDKIKREFSDSLNYIHIEIDCRLSEFEYLKEQFIKSLTPYFNLSNINWIKIYNYCTKSLLIESCNIRKSSNNTISPNEIAKELNINNITVRKYLKIGNNLNLCVYSPRKIYEKVVQYSKNYILINEYDSIINAAKETNINKGNISSCCCGNRKSAGGYIWKFV